MFLAAQKITSARKVWSTYKIFYWTLEFADFFQCLIVSLDFIDVHGQVLEEPDILSGICYFKLYLQHLSNTVAVCNYVALVKRVILQDFFQTAPTNTPA